MDGLSWVSTDIHGAQTMNPTDFGDPLTFSLVPPAGQSFHLSSERSLHTLDGLVPLVSRICIPVTLVISWTFLYQNHEILIYGFELNVSTIIGWIVKKFGTNIHDI